MKDAILELLKAGATRRLAVFALTPLLVLLNSKFGLDLSAEAIGAVVVSSVAYLVQSAWKEAAVKKAEAQVKTPEDAAEVFRRVSK